jgi:hypothetical protein
VVLLVLQTGGTLFFYRVQQLWVQYKMAELAESVAGEEIKLAVGDYQRSKIDDNEILLDGKLYDVREVSITDGIVTLHAVLDEEEGRIIQKITKSAEHGKNKVQHKLIELLTMAYILPAEQLIYYYQEPGQNQFRAFQAYLPKNFKCVDAPPPKEA